MLLEIIDESQSAFVHGKMIYDNIMVAHEIIHTMKNRRNGRTGLLAAKHMIGLSEGIWKE